MAFLRNRTVNLVNLHYAIHAVAVSGGEAFIIVFLLKAGVPAPLVLLAMAAILAGRFLIRPVVLMVGVRVGLRPLLIIGALVNALKYPVLAQVHGADLSLVALCAMSAIGDVFYWTSFHAYFAAVGDNEHRGHQVSAREAVASAASIAGPLATGWILTAWGPAAAFGITGLIQAAAAAPLFFTPQVPVAREAPGALKASMPGAVMQVADGWIVVSYFVWQMALFRSLNESFKAYGGAVALAALAGAVGGMVLGRFIDLGHGRRALWVGFAGVAGSIVLKAVAYPNPVAAVVVNAASALLIPLYIPVMMTAVYNLAKRSPCVLRFHMATEAGWDIGAAGSCLAAAGLMAGGAPLGWSILLALGGAVAALVLLRRYYAGELAPAAVSD